MDTELGGGISQKNMYTKETYEIYLQIRSKVRCEGRSSRMRSEVARLNNVALKRNQT